MLPRPIVAAMRLRPCLLALLALTFGTSVAAPSGAWVPSAVGISADQAEPDRERARTNQRVFDKVWSEVRRAYYDPTLHGVDWDAARATYRPQALAATNDRELYDVLNRMLDLLDDAHASASPPAVARRQDGLRTRRAVVGMTMTRGDDGIYDVERIRAGSPAEAAGIRLGWRIRIDDGGWTPEQDIVEGQPISVSVIDDTGAERTLTLIPTVMEPTPAFVADRSRAGVVVLRIEGFEAGLGRWMGEQLTDLPPETDVVVDLRGNSGGLLIEAEAVLSCFLPGGQTWAYRISRGGRRAILRTETPCGSLGAPVANDVAILVGPTSRSAAELTPAALQEAGRAVVIGERTAGSVLISQDTALADGGRLTLSRSDFITGSGVRLEKTGVEPDLIVPTTVEDRLAGRDPALDRAVALLEGDL